MTGERRRMTHAEERKEEGRNLLISWKKVKTPLG